LEKTPGEALIFEQKKIGIGLTTIKRPVVIEELQIATNPRQNLQVSTRGNLYKL
jgi:hypothetical protein